MLTHDSGKHQIVSSGSYDVLDKDCLPSLPLKRRKANKKIKVFLSRQFCASLNDVC
jgi:hypothetical protein